MYEARHTHAKTYLKLTSIMPSTGQWANDSELIYLCEYCGCLDNIYIGHN